MQNTLDFSQCQKMLLHTVPEFAGFWQQTLSTWDDKETAVSACSYFSVLAEYLHACLTAQQALPLDEIFSLIEVFILNGDKTVKAAATTCFLENLQNQQTPPEAWVHLLGEASRAYCQSWDRFTAVATPGLWPEGTDFQTDKVERLNIALNQAMAEIFAQEPAFKKFWQQQSKTSEQPSDVTQKAVYHLGLLANYVDQQISAEPGYAPASLFTLLEYFYLQGDQALRSGIATGLIERLFQLKTAPQKWQPFLGLSMKSYAQAWGEVLGLNTEKQI